MKVTSERIAVTVMLLLACMQGWCQQAGLAGSPTPANVVAGTDISEFRSAVKAAAAGHLTALGLILRGDAPAGADPQSHVSALASIARLGPEIYRWPPGYEPDQLQNEASAFDQFSGAEPDSSEMAALAAELERWLQASEALEFGLSDNEFGAFSRAWQELVERCQGCHVRYGVDP